ncbi:MAG: OmpA family protein [Crocinitomicaceae bacterium]
MKELVIILAALTLMTACVPAKRYSELVEKEKLCSEELNKFKNSSLNFEADATDLQSRFEVLSKGAEQLKEDTTSLGREHRTLLAKYNKLDQINETLETNYDKIRLSGALETATLQAELQQKQIELQKKEDALLELEKELLTKQMLLAEREQRVNELEKMISEKDKAVQELKDKVKNALKGFENKGLTIEEKNGKIYVSLEAKLLFASGKTSVETEGQAALVGLAKVLETEKDLEIVVEGHTDADKMESAKHPKNNWELSVLRSTSVIEIMLANSEINPAQLMAAGRSQFVPVNLEDKSKNRRIEIIISPNLNELFELIAN